MAKRRVEDPAAREAFPELADQGLDLGEFGHPGKLNGRPQITQMNSMR